MAPPTSPRARSRALDAWRGIAAIMIVGFHANALVAATGSWDALRDLRGSLDLGVVLFFVISGYLVGGPFVRAVLAGRSAITVRDYALRRAARILPGYWMLLVAVVALEGDRVATAPRLALHASLLHGLVPGETYAVVDLSWTLSVEVLFYIAAPLVTWLVLRGGRGVSRRALVWGLAGAGLASALAGTLAGMVGGRSDGALVVTHGFAGCVVLFVPGLLLAALEESSTAGRLAASAGLRRGYGALGVVLVLCAAVLGSSGYVDDTTRNVVAAVGFGLLVALTVLDPVERSERGRILRLLAAAGTVSYGIYLWHWMASTLVRSTGFDVTFGAGGNLAWLAAWAVILVPTLVVASASWFVVERPPMEAAAACIHRRRAAVIALPPAPATGRTPIAEALEAARP